MRNVHNRQRFVNLAKVPTEVAATISLSEIPSDPDECVLMLGGAIGHVSRPESMAPALPDGDIYDVRFNRKIITRGGPPLLCEAFTAVDINDRDVETATDE